MTDLPIPSLAPHFRYEFDILSLGVGLNQELIKQAPDRWGLVIACPIGTRAINPPGTPFPAINQYGVMVMPGVGDGSDQGLLVDDTLPPLRITLPEWGNIVTEPWSFSPFTAAYKIAVTQIFYMPKLNRGN